MLATGSSSMSKTPLPPGAHGQVGTPLKTQFSAQSLVGVSNSPQPAHETEEGRGGAASQILGGQAGTEQVSGAGHCLGKVVRCLSVAGAEVPGCGLGASKAEEKMAQTHLVLQAPQGV